MDNQVVSTPLAEQASAYYNGAIAWVIHSIQGVVTGWNSLPQDSHWLIGVVGATLALIIVRYFLKVRRLQRVNRAMAATLNDPFYKNVTLKTSLDYDS